MWQKGASALMEEERSTKENAILLEPGWEAYFVDEHFGFMVRCTEHPKTKLGVVSLTEERHYIGDCGCMAPTEVWRKLIFLDKLWKINGSR